ncbi:MAG: transcription antitermination factor NusB [Tepidiformaceae bacterium]
MSESVQRRARYLVIEALYESETSTHDAEGAFGRRLAEAAAENPPVEPGRLAKTGERALRGVLERRAELDRQIAAAAPRYPVETMAVVDRNILRLAIWELLSDDSPRVGAVVNEAVELAHRYGGESSPRFVNGVLRTVSRSIQAARGLPPEEAETPNLGEQEN